jgi:drug/metabolite transporter (DMT)-like permease
MMGELFSLMAALIWAAAVIFLRRSGETISPFALNLFKVTITAPLLLLTAFLAGQPIVSRAPPADYLILFASGVIAIAISDTLFHRSLNMIGAGISAVTGCLYSPLVALLAFIMLGERLGPWQLGGMGPVIAGVMVAARHRPPPGVSNRQIAVGVMWGGLAMAAVAFGIVIAKPVLVRSPVLWASAIRQTGSLIVMLPLAAIHPRRRILFSAFRPSPSWRFSLPATLLGSYLALLAWIAGMKYTMTGVAAILNQTSTVFILVLAALILKEAMTRRKALAAALGIAGILMVTLGPAS